MVSWNISNHPNLEAEKGDLTFSSNIIMSFMAIHAHICVLLLLYWMTPTEINASSCNKLFLFYFNSYSIRVHKMGKSPFLHRHSLPLKPINRIFVCHLSCLPSLTSKFWYLKISFYLKDWNINCRLFFWATNLKANKHELFEVKGLIHSSLNDFGTAYNYNLRLGDIKYTTRFINTLWNENSFQILYILIMRSTYEHQNLRFCKTAITWLRSLLAIFWSLFWCHDIAKQHHLCCKDLRNVLRCHEIHDVFPRNMAYVLQNVQFSQYFTMKFNIFSLNLTRESNFFILFIGTQNKLSMISF